MDFDYIVRSHHFRKKSILISIGSITGFLIWFENFIIEISLSISLCVKEKHYIFVALIRNAKKAYNTVKNARNDSLFGNSIQRNNNARLFKSYYRSMT